MDRFFNKYPYTDFHELNLDWIIEQIKDLVDKYKKVTELEVEFEELKQYVNDYFANLNIGEEVRAILDEYIADGTIEHILRSLIFPQRELIISRYMRVLSQYNAGLGGQGSFYDGQFLWLTGNLINSENQTIAKCNLNGEILQRVLYTGLGHANSISADENYLYVADGSAAKIIVIDKNTLNIENIITSSRFDNMWGVSTYNNVTYVLGSDADNPETILLFGKINNGTIEVIHSMINPPSLVRQNLCVYDNTIYMVFNQANIIYSYDLETGVQIESFYIPDGDGYFPTGEIEDLLVINDVLYIMGASYGRYDYSYAQNYPIQFFMCNIQPQVQVQNSNDYSYMESETLLQLIVDDTSAYQANPITTFTTLEEACLLANYHNVAEIDCDHLDTGLIHSINTNVKIIGHAGDRIIRRLWSVNSDMYIRGFTINDIRSEKSNYTLLNCTLGNSLSFRYGNFTGSGCTFRNTTLQFERSIINLLAVKEVASNISITTNRQNYLVVTAYTFVNNLLLLGKINGNGGSLILTGNNKMCGFMISETILANQAFNKTSNDDLQIAYSGGVFSGTGLSSDEFFRYESLQS